MSFVIFGALLLNGCGETIKTAVKKSDEYLYEKADKFARKDEVTGRRELNLSSIENELALGKKSFDQLVTQYEGKALPKDDSRYIRVEKIFKRVIAASHFRNTKTPELAVIDDPIWNAYATTGGRTVFFTGLVDTLTDDQIAVVMGHEIAHSSLSHITEGIWQSRLKTALNRDGVQEGFSESLSVVDEREADEIGLLYSTLAGYDPYAGVEIWSNKATETKSVYDYFSTHPAHAERAAKNAVTASKISKYYLAGQVNPDVETLLTCNNIYCHSSKDKLKGGEGGGYLALLEVAINTALKNRDAKKEREIQAARIQEQQAKDAAIQRRVMLEQEKMPPNIDWHSSWVHRFRGTINRENIRNKGVSVAFSQDTKVSHYYFTIDNQTYQGEIRCYAQDRSGRWCNYSDTFGNGKALVKVLNTTGVIINFINEIGGGQGQVVGNITATP